MQADRQKHCFCFNKAPEKFKYPAVAEEVGKTGSEEDKAKLKDLLR